MSASAFALSRRSLLGAALSVGALPAELRAQGSNRLIAGGYAQEGGPGLVLLTAGPQGWEAERKIPAIRNASFGVQGRAPGIRYLVDEQQKGTLGVYDRALRRLASVPTLGADPCHVALSPDGRTLAVANYSSGSVALWTLDGRTGLPLGEGRRIDHAGNGPNQARQTAPHAHWVGFASGGRMLHAVDLGADAIFSHALDPQTGIPGAVAYRARAGSGPRHLSRHPRLSVSYLVAELANTVTVLDALPDGRFAERQVVSTLPPRFGGSSSAGHIAINRAGTRLYVSNRGHDSIAVFAIDRKGGLQPIQHAGCGGHWPRMFLLLEDRGEMLVANQRSGNVAQIPLHANGVLGRASNDVPIPGVAFLSA